MKYKDTNPNSSSYNDTEWRRASNRDNECKGQTDTSPKWEYIDSSSYGCSSSSSSYKEKTDPYADGYAFRQQKDTNSDSKTYGDTKWVRYSSWDSKCKAIEVEGHPTIYIDPSTGETVKDYTIERIGVGDGWSSHGPKQKELPKGTVVLQVGDIVTEAHYIEVEGSTAPKEIFKYAAKLTNIDSIFRDSSVSNVPEDIFKYLPDITSFEFAFRDCEYLRLIPENLFKDNTEVIKFTGTFYGCTSLSSIPANLFANNKKVEYFGLEEEDPLIYTPSKITEYGCFARCKNIRTIPEDLFKNNTEVKSFAYTFHDNHMLKSIPAGLFRNNSKVRYFKRTFGNTDGTYNWELTSIPSTLFDNCPDVISFDGVFNRQRRLEEVPAGLFKNNKEVLNLQLCFYKSGIERVPEGLFDSCTKVKTVSFAFCECFSLYSVPSTLFEHCREIEDYTWTFSQTPRIYDDIPKVTVGDKKYNLWELEGMSGFPKLINGYSCFTLSGYDTTGAPGYWTVHHPGSIAPEYKDEWRKYGRIYQ